MRRVALISLLVCAALTAFGGPAAGAAKPKRTDAKARLTACKPSLDPVTRSLTVDASMRALGKGDHMQLRFDLFQRPSGAKRFRRLAGPGLGAWNAASPGVDRFRYRKPIQNLPAGATYYVRVTYRWLDEKSVP